MRKHQKKMAEDFIVTLFEAHDEIKKLIKKGNLNTAMDLMGQCQDGIIRVGTLIEEAEGEGFVTVEIIEEYCELVFHAYEEVRQQAEEGKVASLDKLYKALNKKLIQVQNSIKNDIRVRIEAVFLPYKASMWDSLESVWKAADADENCDAYVIPIPYYDKNPDGSFGQMHYEGEVFPEGVSITHYDEYDLAQRRPDEIYIHNPYDEYNLVTSIDPRFYSSQLRNYTDMLVYIPYFIMDEKKLAHQAGTYAMTPGVINANKVIVQSEAVRQAFIDVLLKHMGNDAGIRRILEEKILGIGSPKNDAVQTYNKEDYDIPEDWKKIIGDKKVILYDTHLSLLMKNAYQRFLPKLRSVLKLFKNRTDVVLLWRPHPLMVSTAQSMNPDAIEEYLEIVNEFRNGGWGIYDDTPDMHRAIAISDAFYGSNSSMALLYKTTGKPVLIHNINVRTEDE